MFSGAKVGGPRQAVRNVLLGWAARQYAGPYDQWLGN
jgi:hypothetical protein